MTNAVVYIPAAAHLATCAAQCLAYCASRGYEVTGVVTSDWAAAAAILMGQGGGVLVVARPDHLPPDREPRIEVVAEESPAGDHARQARTRVIRRNAAK